MHTRKAPPRHAYSFGATFLFSALGVAARYLSDNPAYQYVALTGALLSLGDGLLDLHREGKLNRRRISYRANKLYNQALSLFSQDNTPRIANQPALSTPGLNNK